ncbi:hypothetical protein MM239_06070 [Belliella sp. DSM 111904]|uniref:RDD family protein n=1 Tax=Belliella filtrata TaxID=2923435 RepID=A0ABS9UXN8_9BACT|nr:hypothetical protein [Belliella filtrata]MCH7408952.1 hypothetical protein [Belliella filtrata]
MIKQNPFSLYDFLGYFIPGAVLFYIILLLLKIDDINSVNDVIRLINENMEFQFDKVLFFIIISYCLGHLINYLSSITVERFACWKYDYPSKYLLGINREQKYFQKDLRWQSIFIRFFIALLILPISILDFILGEYFLFKNFYTKKLDDFLIDVIKDKCLKLLDSIYPPDYKELRNYDFHRIISHYTFENSKNHQFKMTNYVALYGFLRALSLICCFLFWIFAIKGIREIADYFYLTSKYESYQFTIHDLNLQLTCIIVISSFISYLYFMGFMKFYRRYSLESYMLVAIDQTIVLDQPCDSIRRKVLSKIKSLLFKK